MDPLSIAGSCAGLLSVTFKLTAICIEISTKIKDSPKHFQNLLQELNGFGDTLQDLKKNVDENPDVREAFEERSSSVLKRMGTDSSTSGSGSINLLGHCKNELEELCQKIEKKTAGNKLSRAVERLKWPFEEAETTKMVELLQRYRSILQLSVSIDSLALEALTLKEVKAARKEQNEKHKSDLDEKMLKWLSPLTFDDKQYDVASRRHPDTGQWLLESKEFKNWLKGQEKQDRTLWCPGEAGVGKTFLASLVIDHLTETLYKHDTAVAYIYCDGKNQTEQTPENLIGSILRQLAEQNAILSEELAAQYKNSKSSRIPKISMDTLRSGIERASALIPQVFVVIDALDESDDVHHRYRGELVKCLKALSNSPSPIRLFVTSRTFPKNVAQLFESSKRLSISANERDVQSYLESEIETDASLDAIFSEDEKFKKRVVADLIKKAKGQFLLPALHLKRIADQTCKAEVEECLEDLAGTLHATYEQTWDRIMEQPKPKRDLAAKVLIWTCFTKRSLSMAELCEALIIQPGKHELDDKRKRNPDLLLETCFGLIYVEKDSDLVCPVHFTFQEYLAQKTELASGANEEIAACCITYLGLESFGEENRRLLNTFVSLMTRGLKNVVPLVEQVITSGWWIAKLEAHPFFAYASAHWGSHTKGDLEDKLSEQILGFLDRGTLGSVHEGLMRPAQGFLQTLGITQDSSTVANAKLPFCAAFGLCRVLKVLLDQGIVVDQTSGIGFTALNVAIFSRQTDIVHLLLDYGARINRRDGSALTALAWAVTINDEPIVKLLLERGASIKNSSIHNTPLLTLSICTGHVGIAQALINHGAKVESEILFCDFDDSRGRLSTFLPFALQGCAATAVKVLLEYGIDFGIKCQNLGVEFMAFNALASSEALLRLVLSNAVNAVATHSKIVKFRGIRFEGTDEDDTLNEFWAKTLPEIAPQVLDPEADDELVIQDPKAKKKKEKEKPAAKEENDDKPVAREKKEEGGDDKITPQEKKEKENDKTTPQEKTSDPPSPPPTETWYKSDEASSCIAEIKNITAQTEAIGKILFAASSPKAGAASAAAATITTTAATATTAEDWVDEPAGITTQDSPASRSAKGKARGGGKGKKRGKRKK